jgi:hypothetical protein
MKSDPSPNSEEPNNIEQGHILEPLVLSVCARELQLGKEIEEFSS